MSYSTMIDHNKYPSRHCWNRVHMAIARVTGYTCERCGQRCSRKKFTVHHLGAPYADGRPGDPHDKHVAQVVADGIIQDLLMREV